MPAQRSRGGCHSCKRRKRKCDETRPGCLACQERGKPCGGYNLQLKWSVAETGRQHSVDASEPVQSPQKYHQSTSPEGVGMDSESVISLPGIDIVTDPGQREQLAFQRFLRVGIHGLYATSIHDWIQPIIAENSKHSYALLVVCANIQILLEDGKSLQFHEHFERALQIFQSELSAANGIIAGGTLGAGLLLCTLSLLQGLPWTPHLVCITDLYNLQGDLHALGPLSDLYVHHCLEVMGVMDLPNFVLGRSTPRLGLWKRFRQDQAQYEDDTTDPIEPVSGIPRTLLDICAIIEEPAAESQFWLWRGEIGDFMQCHLWDAWRFAGMIDHRRRWCRAPESPVELRTASALPDTVRLMFRLLSALDSLRLGLAKPENSHMLLSNATVYPWFVASMEVEILRKHPAWQLAMTQYRDQIRRNDSSENIRILLAAVDEAQTRDTPYFDVDAAVRKMGAEIALF